MTEASLAARFDGLRRPLDRDRGGPGTGQRRDPGRLAPVRGRGRRVSQLFPGRHHPGRPTRCCCTSPPARPPSRSWSSTPTRRYPVGHLSTMYWIGLRPGDVHLNISSPGWAKHAWSNVFAPWNAEATVLILGHERVSTPRRCWARSASAASPPSARRRPCGGCSSRPTSAAVRHVGAARVRRGRRAAQPRGDRAGPAGLGHHRPRRLRPDRDHRPGRQLPGPAGQAGLDGPSRSPATPSSWSTPSTGEPAPEGEICLDLSRPPAGADDRLPGRPRAGRPRRCAAATTTPATSRPATTTATSPTSAAPTTCSRHPTTGSARSSWRAC